MSDPEQPVEINQEYGGTLDEPIVVGSQEQGGADNQGMHAFDIQTGAEAAEDFFGSNTQGDQDQNQNQNQGYDDFGGEQQNQGYFNQSQSPGHQQHQSPGHQQHHSPGHNQNQQANYDDDFFGDSQQANQPTSASHQFGGQSNVPAYGGGYSSGGMGMYGENYDPEEEERQERLRRTEQERLRKLDEKAHNEREKKQEKISNAAKELAKWHSEREQNIEKRKQINRQNQELSKSEETEDYKNPWDKVTANIALKEGEYPGTKDVTRFRQALLNKKLDAGKGLNPELV